MPSHIIQLIIVVGFAGYVRIVLSFSCFIYIYFWVTYLWLSTGIAFTNFHSSIHWFNSLIPKGVTRLCQLYDYGVIIYSMYSYSFWQASPLHSGFWNKHSIAITFAAIARLEHCSAPPWISTISFGWKFSCSVGIKAPTSCQDIVSSIYRLSRQSKYFNYS